MEEQKKEQTNDLKLKRDNLEEVFQRVVENTIKDDLEQVSNYLSKVIQKLTPIYDDEPQQVIDVIYKSFFENYEPENHKFRLDMETLSKATDDSTKETLFYDVIETFSEEFKIAERVSMEEKTNESSNEPSENADNENAREESTPDTTDGSMDINYDKDGSGEDDLDPEAYGNK